MSKKLQEALLTSTIKKADDYTVEELEEATATDRFGKEIPMSIEQKRGFLRIIDYTFRDFNFKENKE